MGSDRTVRTRYFVSYNYGQGDLWAFVFAPSEESITSAYPELEVFDPRPPEMSEERFAELLEYADTRFTDIEDDDFWLFEALRSGRGTE